MGLSPDAGTARPVVPIVLNGPGRVGREFVRLLSQETECIAERGMCCPVLRAVQSRSGILFSYEGLTLEDIDSWLDAASNVQVGCREGSRLSSFPGSDYPLVLDLVRGDVPGIVVEATPTDLITGEPGLSHIRAALDKGFSAVSLAKGPLVVAFDSLRSLARERGARLRYSGAVAAALPTVDTALYAMAGSNIFEIEGVLNGTTNYILNSMAGGESYAAALAEAKLMGVAESNPKLDVEGFDSAAKILIIANSVWGTSLGLGSVKRKGITTLKAGYVRECAKNGSPVRLVARAVLGGAGVGGLEPQISVEPEPVPQWHPFAGLPGTSKAIRLRSKNMGEIVVLGGASDITGAAASALKDLILILEGRAER